MKSKLYSVQYLRGIAILLVFLYHSYVVFNKYIIENDILLFFKYSSFIGVVLFFVISGFIMSYILNIKEKKIDINKYTFYFLVVLFFLISNFVIDIGINLFIRIILISFLSGILLFVSLFLKDMNQSKFIKIGDASYGIYLVHLGLLNIFFSLFLNRLGINLNIYSGLILLLITFLLSYKYGVLDMYLYNKLKSIKRN